MIMEIFEFGTWRQEIINVLICIIFTGIYFWVRGLRKRIESLESNAL